MAPTRVGSPVQCWEAPSTWDHSLSRMHTSSGAQNCQGEFDHLRKWCHSQGACPTSLCTADWSGRGLFKRRRQKFLHIIAQVLVQWHKDIFEEPEPGKLNLFRMDSIAAPTPGSSSQALTNKQMLASLSQAEVQHTRHQQQWWFMIHHYCHQDYSDLFRYFERLYC